LRERVTITGWVDSEKKETLMDSAHAFVLLREENIGTAGLFPTRLPEYLIHARPVIMSQAGDLPRYFEHDRDAWMLPPESDPTPLAEAMEQMYRDRDRARRIGRGGYDTALRHFSIESNGSKMNDFLRRQVKR
jgi:glycosyltransferase involved in cell wall biosynthesis